MLGSPCSQYGVCKNDSLVIAVFYDGPIALADRERHSCGLLLLLLLFFLGEEGVCLPALPNVYIQIIMDVLQVTIKIPTVPYPS